MENRSIVFLADNDPTHPTSGGMIRDHLWMILLSDRRQLKTIWANSYPNTGRNFLAKILSAFRSYPENGFNNAVVDELKSSYLPGCILLISRLANGKYISAAKKIGYQVILDEHNVESDLIRQLLPSFLTSPYQWYLYSRLKRVEKEYCLAADRVVATSNMDREKIKKWIDPSKTFIIPNLIAIDQYSSERNFHNRSSILFSGTLDYYPNVAGLQWFLKEVLPIIRIESPAIANRLLVAGRNPTAELKKSLKENGVKLLENPNDMKPLLAESTAMFVPLLHGGGTRIKILESMASGTPVISTAKGAEGLTFESSGLLVADDPKAFARQLIQLATDAENYREKSLDCQKTISEYCALAPYRAQIKTILDSMV